MNDDQFKKFEKSFLHSKKFIAFFLTLLVLAGIDIFIILKIADAGNINMWTAMVLITDIVALSFVSLAFNVKQAAIDAGVRLASILGNAFPADKLKSILGK